MAPPRTGAGPRARGVAGGLTSGGATPDARTRQVFRARTRRLGPPLALLTAVLLLAVVVGVLTGAPALVAVAGLLLPLPVAVLGGLLPVAFPWQRDVAAALLLVLLLLLDALVLAAVLADGRLSGAGEGVLVVAFVLLQAVRLGVWALQLVDGRQQAARVEALHLPGGPPRLPARPPLLRGPGARVSTLASALVPAGLVVALATGADAAVPVAACLAVLLVAAVAAVAGPQVLRHRRLARGRAEAVHAAVAAHAPLVVLYSTSESEDVFWITTWLDTLEHLGRRSVVLVRDPDVVDLLPDTPVPVVCLPDRADIIPFVPPSARVSLYVAHGAENVRLLRSPQLRSAFIGHGDSDKGVSASPMSRGYHEVWVAGEVGRRRYAEAAVGVRQDEIRVVGRPQARRVQRARPRPEGAVPTVMYAPSWEGVSRDPYESSLLHSGLQVVRGLLERGDVRVLYRPHPKTGERDPRFLARHLELVALLEQAGAPHVVDRPHASDVLDRFNEADVLVADRSGVLSDFLASDKPYVVVNATGVPHEQFRAAHLSTGGAYLLGEGAAGLAEALDDALGPDTLRAQRRATREAVVGQASDDPLAPFAAAVDALAADDWQPGATR